MTLERPSAAASAAPLPHALERPVLGVPVRLASNARAVIDAALTSFDGWKVLETYPELIEAGGVDVRIVVREGPAGPAPLVYRRPDAGRMSFAGGGGDGFADAGRGLAAGEVTTGLLADVEQFRYTVLEALVLFLVTGPNRHPVHASAIARDGRALLLAGPSGSGKSTLAWAAAGAGWNILSDDIVYVQSTPRWRVWGGAGARSYLAPDAARFFPELAGLRPALLANGKRKLAVARPAAVPPVCERAGICLLTPGAGAPSLGVADAGDVLEALTTGLEPGFDVFQDGIRERLAPLARQAWRLRTGLAPKAVLPLLEQAFAALI